MPVKAPARVVGEWDIEIGKKGNREVIIIMKVV